MKNLLPILFVLVLLGCANDSETIRGLEARIDSLESRAALAYKPGFGDLMGGIQVHHNKLWFAGQNQNWKLAEFEVHEIRESIEDIQAYHAGREKAKPIGMILPPLDSMDNAIHNEDISAFNRSYTLLTGTCNNCHRTVGHEFVVVKIPDAPPFSNQEFKHGSPQ